METDHLNPLDPLYPLDPLDAAHTEAINAVPPFSVTNLKTTVNQRREVVAAAIGINTRVPQIVLPPRDAHGSGAHSQIRSVVLTPRRRMN